MSSHLHRHRHPRLQPQALQDSSSGTTSFCINIDNPKESLPKALFHTAILVILANSFPLLIGTGAVVLHRESWTDGYFSVIAKIVGGLQLTWLMQGAAAASNMGMFVAKMSSYSYHLLEMAEWGMLPELFSMRSAHGTPIMGILFSTSSILLLFWMSFQEIIAAENVLYYFGMLLEFLAFIRLRIKYPMPCLKHVERKQWLRFPKSPELPDFGANDSKNAVELLDADGRSLAMEELELLQILRDMYPLID